MQPDSGAPSPRAIGCSLPVVSKLRQSAQRAIRLLAPLVLVPQPIPAASGSARVRCGFRCRDLCSLSGPPANVTDGDHPSQSTWGARCSRLAAGAWVDAGVVLGGSLLCMSIVNRAITV
eukprot:517443-Pleurochrysis_carterae.AAC.1